MSKPVWFVEWTDADRRVFRSVSYGSESEAVMAAHTIRMSTGQIPLLTEATLNDDGYAVQG